ncbi:phosphoenolpyruvate carboxykinase (ATP) [Devosia aurantiaca]|uniref:phosphoenolpyruvate carboxykinase (ATP) n=1 Tax=Devosia aurantiaca TaxID=2714858 RepID=UPI001F3CFD07|nr:phosphoenolpyruvate carboxykinase (ATP) [Devosia aurantiaca]
MSQFNHQTLRDEIVGAAPSVSHNAGVPTLVAAALAAGGPVLTAHGAISVETGAFTGRSPKDKFIVRDALTEGSVWWDNAGAISTAQFDLLLADVKAHLAGGPLYRQELLAGADPRHQYEVTVLTPSAWHALFIRNLLIRRDEDIAASPSAMPVTIVHAPLFKADPARHGSRTDTIIALDMSRNLVVIAGTLYAGEIKKSVFSLFNFHAPATTSCPCTARQTLGRRARQRCFSGFPAPGKRRFRPIPTAR